MLNACESTSLHFSAQPRQYPKLRSRPQEHRTKATLTSGSSRHCLSPRNAKAPQLLSHLQKKSMPQSHAPASAGCRGEQVGPNPSNPADAAHEVPPSGLQRNHLCDLMDPLQILHLIELPGLAGPATMRSEDARLILFSNVFKALFGNSSLHLITEVVSLHHVARHTADVPPAVPERSQRKRSKAIGPIIAAGFIQVLQKDLHSDRIQRTMKARTS